MAGWILLAGLLAGTAHGQALRFGYQGELTPPAPRFEEGDAFGYGAFGSEITYRVAEREPPDYATLRIGPFYSTVLFTQTVGYRYTRAKGTGTDYLYQNQRGVIKTEGAEFPMRTSLEFRNYMLITRNMDLDLSVGLYYAHYPLDTQDDEFYVSMAPEGIFGTLATTVDWTPFVRSVIFDRITYRTDYVDVRGVTDRYGGSKYRYFNNLLGANTDWQLAKNQDIILTLSREDMVPFDDAFKDQKRITYRESLAYEQAVIQGLVVGARAGYSQTDYNDPLRANARTDEYSVYGRFGKGIGDETGVRMGLTDLTTLTVGLGYSAGYSAGVSRGAVNGVPTETTADQNSAALSGFASMKTQMRRDLRHELSYRRGLRGGFQSAFEVYDRYRYQIWWDGQATKMNAYSELSHVYPSSDQVSDYSDWASGLGVSYPLVQYITLFGNSIYTVRQNKGAVGADAPEETRYDYTTWVSRVGTSFGIARDVSFSTYFEHAVRSSDSDNLTYTRDTFEATLAYRHQF